jgi:hypothetical protein
MANGEPGGELRIGNALKDARQRAGIDIRTVEEQTKIRTRYLRALESEEWEALPGHAYVKGFLRTYAGLLGLDADALVDEYRRNVEGPQASPVPLGEGVLQARRRLGGRDPGAGPSPALVAGGLVALVVAILLVLGLTGGDEETGDQLGKGERKERAKGGQKGSGGKRAGGGGSAAEKEKPAPKPDTVTLRLVANADGLQVCLLGDSAQPLIDGFAGSAGSDDSFEAKRFRLRFPAGYDLGQFDLFVGGKRAKLEELQGPAAFAIEPPRRIRRIGTPDASCP